MTASRAFQDISVADGKLRLYPLLFSAEESKRYLDVLKEEVDWKSERITLFGRSLALPRMTAWFGDAGMRYTYSGISVQPVGWTRTLLQIRARLEEVTTSTFNSVLLNYYRDGRDSVSWHSDDEPELGKNPVIGSVSFGSERPFYLRHKGALADSPQPIREPIREPVREPAPKGGQGRLKLTLCLPNGSYLEMGAGIQRNWIHQLPKRPKLTEERINLTFRRILSRGSSSMPESY